MVLKHEVPKTLCVVWIARMNRTNVVLKHRCFTLLIILYLPKDESDQRGIETRSARLRTASVRSAWMNRTNVVLKPKVKAMPDSDPRMNRTNVVLKQYSPLGLFSISFGMNRTNVVLKQYSFNLLTPSRKWMNRTNVVLKRLSSPFFLKNLTKDESDQRGIETSTRRFASTL